MILSQPKLALELCVISSQRSQTENMKSGEERRRASWRAAMKCSRLQNTRYTLKLIYYCIHKFKFKYQIISMFILQSEANLQNLFKYL